MTTRPGYIWSGTEWVSIGQEAAVAPVSYQTSAPSSPSTGDIWIDSNDDVPGIDTSQFLRWRKTAAGSETSLSGTDDTGLTLAYTANYEQVYLNGVLLVRGQDYTATNGTSITGLTALAANDVVEVFGVVARVVGDVYTQAQTDDLLDAKSNVSSTGLVLITSVTIGSAVSSVTVSNCFSSAYDNYRVVIGGGVGSTAAGLYLKFNNTTTNYYSILRGWRWANSAWDFTAANNGSSIWISNSTSNFAQSSFDVTSPFLSKRTLVTGNSVGDVGAVMFGGYQDSDTSYTDFTLTPNSGTLTGGTIKVYGYK